MEGSDFPMTDRIQGKSLVRRTARCCARLLFAALVLGAALPADAARAILLVRHADRLDDSADSPLSQAGHERAERLASLLKDTGITAIYTTTARRTIETAAPLARALGITPVAVSREKTEEMLDRLPRHGGDEIVLIVAHSGSLRGAESGMSIPRLLERFGYRPQVRIERMEYDSIFVIFPREQGAPAVLRLRY